MARFGDLLKRLRKDRGKTLREFCIANGLDPGNYSRLERGMYPPPQNVEKYAIAMGLKEGSSEWIELFDTAAAERGQIPADIMCDAEVVDKLPVVFRTLRAKQISPEDLDDLVERIRRS